MTEIQDGSATGATDSAMAKRLSLWDETKAVIADMLQENTGRHMLDSGGAYGRNWERNQGRDFDSEPYGRAEFSEFDGRAAGDLATYPRAVGPVWRDRSGIGR